jgi:inosose dehydratase
VIAGGVPFLDAVRRGVMCPIGTGMIDYPAIHECLTNELGYEGYITVEQDRDPRNSKKSLADEEKSRDYLTSIGFVSRQVRND